jgi:Tfp pilus assembly protein PilV
MYRNIRNKKGMLLVEVLVAVTVMGVGLTMVSRSFTNCLRVLESAGDYHIATVLAEEVFTRLTVMDADDWPSKGKFDDYPKFSWTLESGDFEAEGFEDIELKEVTLQVRWERRNRDYRLTIPTLIHSNEET